MKGRTFQEILIAVLAHGQYAITLDEFLDHPVIRVDKERVQATLNSLVNEGIFVEDISTYPSQEGRTVYAFAPNEGSQQAFNKAIAEG